MYPWMYVAIKYIAGFVNNYITWMNRAETNKMFEEIDEFVRHHCHAG